MLCIYYPRQKKVTLFDRCVLNASLENGANLPTDLSDLMEHDLVMNIYRGGQWGSFRHLSGQRGRTRNTTTDLAPIRPSYDAIPHDLAGNILT